ncbi:hypothetical protein KGF57_003968 [Candida theae]|uniref:Uncharacterized protein n=1 Tax=Candida theae TaxID=1198502 RepID=A0AAD5BC45_9ASCO|nr:uncharacterized protein KGF57_003968 [Candida theae]KAI5953759.1 hypothetical protein KGF57_003968 [Candida theae]
MDKAASIINSVSQVQPTLIEKIRESTQNQRQAFIFGTAGLVTIVATAASVFTLAKANHKRITELEDLLFRQQLEVRAKSDEVRVQSQEERQKRYQDLQFEAMKHIFVTVPPNAATANWYNETLMTLHQVMLELPAASFTGTLGQDPENPVPDPRVENTNRYIRYLNRLDKIWPGLVALFIFWVVVCEIISALIG